MLLFAGATVSAMVFLLFVYILFRQLQFLPIFFSVLAKGFFANAAAPIALVRTFFLAKQKLAPPTINSYGGAC